MCDDEAQPLQVEQADPKRSKTAIKYVFIMRSKNKSD